MHGVELGFGIALGAVLFCVFCVIAYFALAAVVRLAVGLVTLPYVIAAGIIGWLRWVFFNGPSPYDHPKDKGKDLEGAPP